MTFPRTLRSTTVALVALTAGVRGLDAQSARLDFGTPSPRTAQIPLSVGIISHGTSIWRGVLWGAAVGAVAAGAVCAADESCRRNGGVSEDAIFGAALGAAVGGVVVAVARAEGFARRPSQLLTEQPTFASRFGNDLKFSMGRRAADLSVCLRGDAEVSFPLPIEHQLHW